jgi:hypothetical protein
MGRKTMSDKDTTEAPTDVEVEASVETDQQTAGEVDWIREARKWENLAKKNLAEARANAEAAKKLAEIEDSSKSEVEKAQKRLEEAEQRAKELEFQVNRATVANSYKVPMDLLAGPKSSSPEDIEEYAKLLIDFKGEKEPNPVVSAEGKTPPMALNGSGIEDALRNALGVR